MFKYRVLTFTIILSMLLFYATPIGCIDVKADEVEYTQQQLQDVGAWFIGERLLEGAIENFDFSNLPTDVTAEDFLADLGAIIAEGNGDPLLDDLGQVADDIWNSIEQELNSWSAEDGWNFAKDFFYTLWYDVPSSPSLPPLANVFGIAADVLEASGVDKLLQYANTDIPETYLPQDYAWFQAVNSFYFNDISFESVTRWFGENGIGNLTPLNDMMSYSYFITGTSYLTKSFHLPNNGQLDYPGFAQYYISAYAPKLTIYYNTSSNTCTYSATGSTNPFNGFSGYSNLRYFYSFPAYQQDGIYVNGNNSYNGVLRSDFPDFTTAINWFYSNLYNITLYVDDVLWVHSNIVPINPIASTDLTYPNYEPAKYIYPDGTSVDWNRLYSIIYNAVRDGIVIDFGDLEDCFVDVNGQTAIATLGLVRNDYDNLVDEQFNIVPYPRFNNNLWLTNLADEMTEPAQNGVAIIENTYNIFPLPLQKALLFAGALLLFGLLIRRFLE